MGHAQQWCHTTITQGVAVFVVAAVIHTGMAAAFRAQSQARQADNADTMYAESHTRGTKSLREGRIVEERGSRDGLQ